MYGSLLKGLASFCSVGDLRKVTCTWFGLVNGKKYRVKEGMMREYRKYAGKKYSIKDSINGEGERIKEGRTR